MRSWTHSDSEYLGLISLQVGGAAHIHMCEMHCKAIFMHTELNIITLCQNFNLLQTTIITQEDNKELLIIIQD